MSGYDNTGSSREFGRQWQLFNKVEDAHALQFQGWTSAAGDDFFKHKKILDAGCGIGRNAVWAANLNPVEVVGIDLDPLTIEAAKRNTANNSKIKIQIGSIYEVGDLYASYFDSILCIGVLHHLADPALALNSFKKALNGGGELLLWVYGRKGNGIIFPIIRILRTISPKLPFRVNLLASLFFADIYRVLVALRIIKNEYAINSRKLNRKQLHNIVLDQLIPKIANYWTDFEVNQMLQNADFTVLSIKLVNGNSWSVLARKN